MHNFFSTFTVVMYAIAIPFHIAIAVFIIKGIHKIRKTEEENEEDNDV